ncbi:penicillin acylase [Rugamonas sp. FT82W]|uniref:Penicillin acylase n=1 Tax=Duganella vulcania TaxID=2692166 RepID=A0A845G7H4_9BURK|nr:penicillin acylase family protein [Duganella vulcania]MYM89345.1 penicillin acylase [Duganella vulcania]
MATPASKVFSLRYLQGLCLAFAAGLPSHAAAADVTIKRDNYGVPHIYANNVRSLFYGYGYAVAEDRLYQMEMVKRSAQGTVAEVLGADHVAVDRVSRADLDPASLRRQLATLRPADRDIFEGYAAGFNARIREVLARRQALMPKEFIDAGFEPTYWTAYDVASVWVGLILNRFFSGNMEMANLNLLSSLKAAKGDEPGTRIYRQLRWTDDPTAPTIDANVALAMPPQSATAQAGSIPVNYLREVSPPAALDYQAVALARLGPAAAAGMPTASNAWVVAPRKSADGNTVLYNGPQQGWFSPSIIYSVGLHGAGFDVTGSTPAGLPAIFFGTNGKIAWGSTVGGLDTNDLYQEQLDPDDQHRYRYQGQWRNMALREETLRVKDGADIALQIHATVHGEVQSWDVAKHTAYTLKRSWRGHEVETLLGWIHVSRAGNWKQFLAQAQRVAASITWFYADKSGNIGYAGLGRLPRRPATQQIQFPANGDGSMEWRGSLPFSANPKQLNPAQGYLVSWNNKTMPGLTADGADYSYVDRVNELGAQLAAQPSLSKDAIWNIDRRAATADLNHRYFGAYLRQAVAGLPADDRVRQAAQLVADWDGQLVDDGQGAYRNSAAVAIFHAWLPLMLQELLQPDLPKDVYAKYAATGYLPALSPLSAKPGAGAKQLWYALQQGRGGAPFAYDFLHGRDADQLIRATLGQALTTLAARQGPDQRSWRVPVVPMQFAAVSAIGVLWGAAAGAHVVAPYRNRGSVSVLVTLGRDGVSMCSAAAPGQSAFINAEGTPDQHYADQLPLFETFSCKEDHLTPSQVDAHLERVIRPSR